VEGILTALLQSNRSHIDGPHAIRADLDGGLGSRQAAWACRVEGAGGKATRAVVLLRADGGLSDDASDTNRHGIVASCQHCR